MEGIPSHMIILLPQSALLSWMSMEVLGFGVNASTTWIPASLTQ